MDEQHVYSMRITDTSQSDLIDVSLLYSTEAIVCVVQCSAFCKQEFSKYFAQHGNSRLFYSNV